MERLTLLYPDALFISAATGEGLDALKTRIAEQLNAMLRVTTLVIPHDRYDIISKLHATGGIQKQSTEDDGVHIEGRFPASIDGIIEPFRN